MRMAAARPARQQEPQNAEKDILDRRIRSFIKHGETFLVDRDLFCHDFVGRDQRGVPLAYPLVSARPQIVRISGP